jgi:hypothetical protein
MQAGDSHLTLIKACQGGRVETTTVLLDNGANVNQTEVNTSYLKTTKCGRTREKGPNCAKRDFLPFFKLPPF